MFDLVIDFLFSNYWFSQLNFPVSLFHFLSLSLSLRWDTNCFELNLEFAMRHNWLLLSHLHAGSALKMGPKNRTNFYVHSLSICITCLGIYQFTFATRSKLWSFSITNNLQLCHFKLRQDGRWIKFGQQQRHSPLKSITGWTSKDYLWNQPSVVSTLHWRQWWTRCDN